MKLDKLCSIIFWLISNLFENEIKGEIEIVLINVD